VARAGELDHPHVPSPPRLLPYLEFSKYPQAALDVTRRVLDDDDEFRSRVLASVDLDALGEAAALFLGRPDGWEQSLADLEASADSLARSTRTDREERRATKQLQITREMLDEARRTASSADAELGRLRDDLAREQAARRELQDRVEGMETAVETARRERATAVRELKDMESRLADRTLELRASNDRVAALEEEVRQSQQALGEDRAGEPQQSSMPDASTGDGEPPLDRVGLAVAIADASSAAAQLAEALDRAARGVQPPTTCIELPPSAPPRSQVRARRRRPVPLPVGIFDDSVEAAEVMVATPGMVMLVDGYNVTLSGWPELELELQRERLIDGLAAVQSRTDLGVVVVFDGAEAGRDLPPSSRLRGVQVRFTDPGVEADDVIIDAVRSLPSHRPVTVVSSDRRVRDGAAAGGANLLESQQLLGLLRRS